MGINARWREKNPERAVAVAKLWVENNRDAVRDTKRRYKRRHPHTVTATNHARRAAILGAIPAGYDIRPIRVLHLQAARLTRCTGIKWHLDHILPLRRGGKHTHMNVQPLPASLNFRKHDNPAFPLPAGYRVAV